MIETVVAASYIRNLFSIELFVDLFIIAKRLDRKYTEIPQIAHCTAR